MFRLKSRRKKGLPKIDSEKLFSFLFKNVPFLIFIIFVALLTKGIFSFLYNSPHFNIAVIETEGTKDTALAKNILKNIGAGINIFRLDLKEIASDLKDTHQEFERLTIRKVFPNKLIISVKKRIPFAQVRYGKHYLVTKDGVILPNPQTLPVRNLPLIEGIEFNFSRARPGTRCISKQLQKGVSLINEVSDSEFGSTHKIVKVDMLDNSNISFFIEDGTEIKIGASSFKEKQPALTEIMADLKKNNRLAKYIDLRFKDAVVALR